MTNKSLIIDRQIMMDVSKITTLLALPCALNNRCPFPHLTFETYDPLAHMSMESAKDIRKFAQTYKETYNDRPRQRGVINYLSGEDLTTLLHRNYTGAKLFEMSCEVFAQLAYAELTGKLTGKLLLHIGEREPQHELIGCIHLNNDYNTEPACGFYDTIGNWHRWTIRIGQNDYLGLTESGPKILTLKEWAKELREKLLIFRQDYKSSEERDLIERQFPLERIRFWTFYSKASRSRPTVVYNDENYQELALMN